MARKKLHTNVSTYNERKSVVSERFIRNLKKICKYMTTISKNVNINQLDEMVNKYNNKYHRTIKIESANLKPSIHIDFNEERISTKLKFDHHVKISKYGKFIAKAYFSNWSEDDFVITKVKNTVLWAYVISDEEIGGTFYEKEFQNKKNLE